MTRPTRDDRGGAAITGLLTTMVLLAVLLPVLVAVADLLATARTVRSAADAAALAVLSGSPLSGGTGAPDTTAGHEIAEANGARLASVDLDGWPTAVVVTATTSPSGVLGDLLGDLTARAAARLEPPDARTSAPPQPP